MAEDIGSNFEFVTSVRTRWFSHCNMVFALFKARKYLKEYKNSVCDHVK